MVRISSHPLISRFDFTCEKPWNAIKPGSNQIAYSIFLFLIQELAGFFFIRNDFSKLSPRLIKELFIVFTLFEFVLFWIFPIDLVGGINKLYVAIE